MYIWLIMIFTLATLSQESIASGTTPAKTPDTVLPEKSRPEEHPEKDKQPLAQRTSPTGHTFTAPQKSAPNFQVQQKLAEAAAQEGYKRKALEAEIIEKYGQVNFKIVESNGLEIPRKKAVASSNPCKSFIYCPATCPTNH